MKTGKRKTLIITLVAILILIISLVLFARQEDAMNLNLNENVVITSEAFQDGGTIPKKYTGQGEDVSPDLRIISELSPEAVSIAIIMDDLDFPFRSLNHWVIWNLPVMDHIPEAIPAGETVETLGGAVQGIGYGKHRYKGANPPFGSHRYKYQVFVLDTLLDLNSSSRKKDLLEAMEGHILQYGSITGKFK